MCSKTSHSIHGEFILFPPLSPLPFKTQDNSWRSSAGRRSPIGRDSAHCPLSRQWHMLWCQVFYLHLVWNRENPTLIRFPTAKSSANIPCLHGAPKWPIQAQHCLGHLYRPTTLTSCRRFSHPTCRPRLVPHRPYTNVHFVRPDR